MHQALSERKREILIRSAESRLGVVESLDSAMRGAGRTWELMSVPRKVVRAGVTVGGGALGILLFRRLFGSRPKPLISAPVTPRHALSDVLLQGAIRLLPVLLAPWLRSQVMGAGVSAALERLQPARAFFRWLGLER